MRGLLACGLQRVQLGAELGQLGAEVADTLVRLLLLRRVELLLGQRAVLVDGAREGGQRGRERAEGRGGRELWLFVGGIAGGGGVRREGGEVFADRGALLER
jgi:hypothetical protein